VNNVKKYLNYTGVVALVLMLIRGTIAASPVADTAQSTEIFSLPLIEVIGVRQKREGTEKHLIQVNDRLSHDGASVISQSTAISGIRKSGRYGFDPVLRGSKYEQLNIVVDGSQCAIAACPNRMDPPLSQISPNLMEKVEIVKGPYSFRYGIAFGGSINFKSSPLTFSDETHITGRLSTGAESNGSVLRTEGSVELQGKQLSLATKGSFSRGKDYFSGNNIQIPGNFERLSLSAVLAVAPAENQDLLISATYNDAQDVDFAALPMDLRSDETWLTSLSHQLELNRGNWKKISSALTGSIVDHRMDNLTKSISDRMVDAVTTATTYSFGGRSEALWRNADYQIISGADLQLEQVDGARKRTFIKGMRAGTVVSDNVWNGGRIVKPALFAEFSRHKHGRSIEASTRIELNHAEALSADQAFAANTGDLSALHINPNVSLGISHRIARHYRLSLWVARAQRSGGIAERYVNSLPIGIDPYEMLGTPALAPEVNNQIDASAEFTNSTLHLSINPFLSYLQNYISSSIDTSVSPILPSSPGVRRFTNIQQAMKTGFEITCNHDLAPWLNHSFTTAYTYGQDLSDNEPLPEITPLQMRYTLSGHFFNNRLVPEVHLRHSLSQQRVSETFAESSTPSFTVVNFSVLMWLYGNSGVSLRINNMLNETYYKHLSRQIKGTTTPIYAEGRNIIATFFTEF